MHMKKTLEDEDHESTQMMNGQKTVLTQGQAHLPASFEDFRLLRAVGPWIFYTQVWLQRLLSNHFSNTKQVILEFATDKSK